MKSLSFLTISFFLIFSNIQASTLDEVKKRDYLKCGIADDIIGFSSFNDLGEWVGFDVDFCKAIAAAIFGDTQKIEYVTTTSKSRFPALASAPHASPES